MNQITLRKPLILSFNDQCNFSLSDKIKFVLHPTLRSLYAFLGAFVVVFILTFLIVWIIRIFMGRGIKDLALITKVATSISAVPALLIFYFSNIPQCL